MTNPHHTLIASYPQSLPLSHFFSYRGKSDKDTLGRTGLQLGALEGYVSVVKLLLGHKLEAEKDSQGLTIEVT